MTKCLGWRCTSICGRKWHVGKASDGLNGKQSDRYCEEQLARGLAAQLVVTDVHHLPLCCSEKLLAQRLAAVARQMSNASLQQLPEYHQRVKVRIVGLQERLHLASTVCSIALPA